MTKCVRITCGVSISHWPGRRAICSALVTVLFLTLTASAMAWRPPTQTERSLITQVASRPAATQHEEVHVTGIRISTVGPWASAGVMGYRPILGAPDAIYILHKVDGKWIIASSGSSAEWCVMPRKDIKNLGFPVSYRCGPQS